jgi:hypothetical protein
MKRDTCEIRVKVLAHWLIEEFIGEAISAAPHPRFVVALLIADTRRPHVVDRTDVSFTTHEVAFFAVGSITKVFAESDIVGKEYRLTVEQREIDGKRSYGIGVIG